MIATRKRRSRSLAETRRRRKRRRLLQMWCSRLIVLFIIIIIVLLFSFIIAMFKSCGKEKVSETASHSNEVIEAEPTAIPITTYTATEKDAIEEVLDDSEATIHIMSRSEVTQTAEPIPEPRISAYGPGEVYYYQFTYEEKLYIAKVVYAEARGEIFEGQVAVAAVVINRFFSDDPFFDNDSIESVVLQRTQFAPIDDVTEEKLENCPSCMEAVEAACKGYDPTRKMFDDGAKYFFDPQGITSEYQLRIRKDIEVLIIGNHHFHNEFNEEEVSKGR